MTAPTRPSPYDQAITAIEQGIEREQGSRPTVHRDYALTALRSERQGWWDCEDKLLPIIKELREMLTHWPGLDRVISDEGIALITKVEELTGIA